MAAYVIAQVDVTDTNAYQEYARLVPGTVAAYGGRYIVRAGRTEAVEGNWEPKRLVIIEFPDVERARAWYDSEEYREPKAIRHKTATSSLTIVEGA